MAKELTFKIKMPELGGFLALLRRAIRRAWSDMRGRPWRACIAVVAAVAAFIIFGISAAILWGIFLLFLLYEWENRIFAVIAILFLVSCPILLSINQSAWAETAAVYAYYFLVMTVMLQIVEYVRQPSAADAQA